MNDNSYDRVAGEYYAPHHKTSRNFDSATEAAIAALGVAVPPDGLVLEPGCGRGRSNEFLGVDPQRIVQLDNSRAMLALARRERCLLRVLHDAEDLPFPDGEFGCVAAFLSDAFLGLNFLGEVRRVLRPDGLLIGTTPSFQWGTALRDGLDIDRMTTRFRLTSGEEVHVPSAIFTAQQLGAMLESVGFRPNTIRVHSHRLPPNCEPISDDIIVPARHLGVSPLELDILYTFVAMR